jgi:hypothetical protein
MTSRDYSETVETVTYDSADEADIARSDWRGTASLSISVVETVGSVTGMEPLEMDPLHEVIDPDALNQLFEDSLGLQHSSSDRHVQLQYMGCTVTVYANGRMTVSPPSAETA